MQSAHAEKGQVLILWILAATVILVMGAVVVDVGLWLTERRRAQNAADFAALAAATELHKPGGDPVGVGEDFAQRNGFGAPDATVTVTPQFNGDPDMVEVTIEQSAPMLFTSVFGAGVFDIGARAVGTDPAEEVDVVMILDRSRSIEGTNQKTQKDVDRMKDGARAALQAFDPAKQHVALGLMWKSNLSSYDSGCSFANDSWVPVPLSADYHSGTSALGSGIDCLAAQPPGGRGVPQGLSNQGTDWATPILEARNLLKAGSARKAIILLADGHPQGPGSDPCESAFDQATQAGPDGIEIYTIGYAIENDICEDNGPPYSNKKFSQALADIATDPTDDNPSHCAASSDVQDENTDGDHFFCVHRFDDLAPVFAQIAAELARDYRLEE